MKKVCLTDLIPLNDLQEMQDSFSEVANVAIRTVNTEGRTLTSVSGMPSLCLDALTNQALREKICNGCRPTFLGGEGIVDDDLSFDCLPGLKNYLVPLKVAVSETESLILGYMIMGPVVFMKRKSKEEFRAIAEDVGVDGDQLWNLILELRVFSFKAIRSFLDMAGNLMSRMLGLAYGKSVIQKNILNRLSREFPRKAAGSLDALKEVSELFLDLIVDFTRCSIGSVMLLDRKKKALVIKASCGLPAEVAERTSLKVGEGISGLAAQMKKSFLINEGEADELVAERLKRPNLFSSVVVPIKCHDDVYGVINISSEKTYPVKLDKTTLSFVTKAAGLAGMALEQLQS